MVYMKGKPDTDIILCGLIGYPLKHSISPQMHNAAFDALNLNFAYLPFEIKKYLLKDMMGIMRGLNFRGLNVTIPHKESVVKYLDALDASAAEAGAVNTIVNRNGSLIGYNTDIAGFLKALKKYRVDVRGEKAVILGTGGAAKAVALGLLKSDADVAVVGRSMQKSRKFAKRFQRLGQIEQYTFGDVRTAVLDSRLVINCTPIGMHPNTNVSPIDKRCIEKSITIFDVVYNPIKTRLLTYAEEKGAKAISGIDMLVYQGAESFELWTGKKAPIEIMMHAALTNLQEFDEK
ncbi:MAG: shikimate dehydrogenase [Thermoplasmata archaeon]